MNRKIKLPALILAAVMAITCCACSDKATVNTKPKNDKPQSSQSSDGNTSDNTSSGDNEDFDIDNNSSNQTPTNDELTVPEDDGSPNADKYKGVGRLNLFDSNGTFAYKIVYSSTIDDDDKNLIMKTWRVANRASSTTIKIYSDSDLEIKNKNSGLLLFCDADFKSVEKAKNALLKSEKFAYDDYIIAVEDGNIVIYSNTYKGRNNAVQFFNTKILQSNDGLTLPKNYCYIHHENVKTNFSIDSVDISKYIIVMEKYPSYMLTSGADEIVKNIKEKTEFEIPVIKTDKKLEYKYKIQLSVNGNTPDDYSLSINNGVVNIKGGRVYSLNAAIHRFAASIGNAPTNKKVNIPKNFSFSGKYNSDSINTNGYKLVFSDDFSGSALNRKYWTTIDYPIATQGAGGGRYSFNVSVKDGKLNLGTSAEKKEDGMYYYGSGMNSNFSLQFGYLEIRAKINKGTGIWPSFWLQKAMTPTQQFHPEIDIFEFFGSDTDCVSQLHSWWPAGSTVVGQLASEAQNASGHIEHLSETNGNTYKLPGNSSFADDYHVYGCEWTPTHIKFSCDGYVYCTVNIQSELKDSYGAPLNEYMMFLNSDMIVSFWSNLGDAKYGKIDENTLIPSCYYIDYFNLYQQPGVGYFNLP